MNTTAREILGSLSSAQTASGLCRCHPKLETRKGRETFLQKCIAVTAVYLGQRQFIWIVSDYTVSYNLQALTDTIKKQLTETHQICFLCLKEDIFLKPIKHASSFASIEHEFVVFQSTTLHSFLGENFTKRKDKKCAGPRPTPTIILDSQLDLQLVFSLSYFHG